MRILKISIALDGIEKLFKGSRAVTYKELIMSNKGYIEMPNKNVSQPFVAMTVTSVVSVSYAVSSSFKIYGGK